MIYIYNINYHAGLDQSVAGYHNYIVVTYKGLIGQAILSNVNNISILIYVCFSFCSLEGLSYIMLLRIVMLTLSMSLYHMTGRFMQLLDKICISYLQYRKYNYHLIFHATFSSSLFSRICNFNIAKCGDLMSKIYIYLSDKFKMN